MSLERSHLNEHMTTHSNTKPYACPCGRAFATKRRLLRHEKRGFCNEMKTLRAQGKARDGLSAEAEVEAGKEKDKEKGAGAKAPRVVPPSKRHAHKCEECDSCFKTIYDRDKHHDIRHCKDKPFSCTTCLKPFATEDELSKHMERHENGLKVWGCFKCHKCFKRRSALTEHIHVHTEKEVLCEDCGASFNSPFYLKRHRKLKHGHGDYACTICNRKFPQPNRLREHMRIHTGEKPYTCEYCAKSFASYPNVKQHIRAIHTGEKPFHCKLCDYRCAQNSMLTMHMRTHSKEANYACDMCDRRFKRPGPLRDHKRRHLNIKRYACDVCDKAFVSTGELKDHKATHSDVRPHACPVCGTAFKRRDAMYQHMRSQHPGVPIPKLRRYHNYENNSFMFGIATDNTNEKQSAENVTIHSKLSEISEMQPKTLENAVGLSKSTENAVLPSKSLQKATMHPISTTTGNNISQHADIVNMANTSSTNISSTFSAGPELRNIDENAVSHLGQLTVENHSTSEILQNKPDSPHLTAPLGTPLSNSAGVLQPYGALPSSYMSPLFGHMGSSSINVSDNLRPGMVGHINRNDLLGSRDSMASMGYGNMGVRQTWDQSMPQTNGRFDNNTGNFPQ